MRVSTSSGVMPGALRMSLTCVVETSGKASMGSCRNDWMPAPMSSTVSSATSRRCERLNATSLFNMAYSPPSAPTPVQIALICEVPDTATAWPAASSPCTQTVCGVRAATLTATARNPAGTATKT